MTGATTAAIGLGSNVGPRETHLHAALTALRTLPGTALLRCSTIVETAPVGPPQGPYLNAAALLRTTLDPRALLRSCHAIEASRGRRRSRPSAQLSPLPVVRTQPATLGGGSAAAAASSSPGSDEDAAAAAGGEVM